MGRKKKFQEPEPNADTITYQQFEKEGVKKFSDSCRECEHQCKAGLEYIELIDSGQEGHGVVCYG